MIAMQLPRDQQIQQAHELEQAVQALEDDGDFYHTYPIVDAHPLAPQTNGHCQRGAVVQSNINASVASLTHGQNFSHMYKPPNVIHVRIDPEEDKGIEVYIYACNACMNVCMHVCMYACMYYVSMCMYELCIAHIIIIMHAVYVTLNTLIKQSICMCIRSIWMDPMELLLRTYSKLSMLY